MKEILQLVDISKRFPGNQALSSVSVTFHENEIHGIVGKNGAGKSTLMNIVMGIIDADEGEIFFNDTGSPALIKDPGDFDSIFVVMPMKG